MIWCAWGYADAPGDIEPDAVADHPLSLIELIEGLIDLGPPPGGM